MKRTLALAFLALAILTGGFLLILQEQSTEARVIGIPEPIPRLDCHGESMEVVWGELLEKTILGRKHTLGLLSVQQGVPPKIALQIDGVPTEPFSLGNSILIDYNAVLRFTGLNGENTAELCILPN